MAEPDAAVDDLTRRILSSAKYRSLDETLVRRVASDAVQRFQHRKDAAKYAQRKLHQAFGAFLDGSPVSAVDGFVAAVTADPADIREAALTAMRAHASAAERADWLTPLYDRIGAWCGEADSVIDLACGLNPLAIPWMHLSPDARYRAYEVDGRLVGALARLDEVMAVRFTAETCDLVAAPPAAVGHMALMLKTVTTLEQQRPGAAGGVLAGLCCRHVILSLPRGSLSGRRTYVDDPARIAAEAVAASPYDIDDEATFGNEVVYHLAAHAGPRPELRAPLQ
jgi:16S rRNA (guanine(1405)-N(7))-methyltransferase